MDAQRRSTIALGIALIVLGGIFLATQLIPGLALVLTWPWIVIGVGALLLLVGILVGAPDMAVPAFVVGGIGGILYYQNQSGDWTSWSYIWALIPVFFGLGMLVAALLGARSRYAYREALRIMLSGVVMFVIFGALFGAFSGLGPYWPLLLVGAGLLVLVNGLVKR